MFKRIFFGILFNGLCLYAVVQIIDGVTYSGGFVFFVVSGLILGILNAFVKPILKFFSFPLVFLTGGLFAIVINAILLWMLEYFLNVAKFSDLTLNFDNLSVYLLSALVFGLVNWILNIFIKK